MKEQTERGPGIVRSAVLAVHIIREEHCLDFLGFVVPIEKIAKAASKERNKVTDLLRRHSAKPIPKAQKFPPTFSSAKRWIRRRLQKKRLQITSKFFQLIVHTDKRLRIARRNLVKFPHSAFAVRPPGHHTTIGKRNNEARVARNHP